MENYLKLSNFYIFRFFIKFLKEYDLYPTFFNFIKNVLIYRLGCLNRIQSDKKKYYEEEVHNLMIFIFYTAKGYSYSMVDRVNSKGLFDYKSFDFQTVEALWLLDVAKNRRIDKVFRALALNRYKNHYATIIEKQKLKLDKL